MGRHGNRLPGICQQQYSSWKHLAAPRCYPAELAGQECSYHERMVSPDSPELAYVQLANELAARITAGTLLGRMPSERAIAEDYGVSYGTVRRAIAVLRDRGLVVSVHGRGTFTRQQ
jgi:GntR family transcriptional regulator